MTMLNMARLGDFVQKVVLLGKVQSHLSILKIPSEAVIEPTLQLIITGQRQVEKVPTFNQKPVF